MEISQSQCAEIAILMLVEYQKYLTRSHFSFLTFEEWLQKIIEQDKTESENTLKIEAL